MTTFPIETDLSDSSIQKLAIVNVSRLAEMASQREHRQANQTPNNQLTCFLRNIASVRGRIALGRMDIEYLIRTCRN
jgi:hypothetical protein